MSAIGHEQDLPLVDLAADLRASTPTDAAKRIVPDVTEELQLIASLRARGHRTVTRAIATERQRIDGLSDRARRSIGTRIDRGRADITHLTARLRALSPAATLERGYAVVTTGEGAVIRAAEEVRAGEQLQVRVARGAFTVTADAEPHTLKP